MFIAERQGFEPWEQLPVHRISSAARSTTPASFHSRSLHTQKLLRCKDNVFLWKLHPFLINILLRATFDLVIFYIYLSHKL